MALHAACIRIAHISGAAEVLNEIGRDIEETRVIALDRLSEVAPMVRTVGIVGPSPFPSSQRSLPDGALLWKKARKTAQTSPAAHLSEQV